MSTNEIAPPGYTIPSFIVDPVDREHIRQVA